MSPRVTVLIPTFDHGQTLRYALGSALGQTVEDIEVFVVGDGVPTPNRPLVEGIAGEDPRVRFFANEKGPRHGEIHRARALAEASGRIVCYLADDDLWLPEHLELMLELLETTDFAHCLPLRVEPDGSLGGWPVNLAEGSDRDLLMRGENRIPLSCSGHTLEVYRRLPWGWRTTPNDIPTDLYMFQQLLSVDGLRAVSGSRPTCLHFPSPARPGWTTERRCAELERWARLASDADWRRGELQARVLELHARGWAERDAVLRDVVRHRDELESRLAETREESREQAQHLERSTEEVARLALELEDARTRAQAEASRLDQAEWSARHALEELERMKGTLTWRLRARLLSLPAVGGLLRRAAEARARRGDR